VVALHRVTPDRLLDRRQGDHKGRPYMIPAEATTGLQGFGNQLMWINPPGVRNATIRKGHNYGSTQWTCFGRRVHIRDRSGAADAYECRNCGPHSFRRSPQTERNADPVLEAPHRSLPICAAAAADKRWPRTLPRGIPRVWRHAGQFEAGRCGDVDSGDRNAAKS